MNGIAYWIEKRAYITPNRSALIGENRRLTYLQMADEIRRISSILLKEYGAKKGARIAILSGNNIEYFLLLFSIARIGGIAVPLNLRLSSKELEYQLNDSGASILITSDEFFERGKGLVNRGTINHLIKLEDLLSEGNREITVSSYFDADYNDFNIDGSLPFIIMYTSGTTGRPKGAVLTQENMFWNAVNNVFSIDITSNDRMLTILPLFHIGGLGLFAFPTLLAGGTVIVPNKFEPEQALQLIEKEKITVVMGVPTIFDALMKSKSFSATDFQSVRWFYSGGAPCPHDLIHAYLKAGIPFGQGYGMTETSPTVFMMSKEDYSKKIGSIGKPAPFVDIRIVNEHDEDMADNEVGELVFRGPNVFKEYWNLPNETEKSFKDGWFYSGDLAKRDEDGFIYIAGRKKEMIISGGENIYPLEVEQAIGQNSKVAEVAVIGIPDEKWGEIPMAIIALKDDEKLSEQELIDYCKSYLAKYKIPKVFKFVSALPKNATGKIDKAAIKNEYSG